MPVSNEARIKVRIDGKDAEISVSQLGKAIQTTMKKANEESKKLQTSWQKIGDFSQKFFFIASSLRMVTNQMSALIAASNKQEEAEAALAQVMKSMSRYTDEAFVSVKKLASQIQGDGIIGDEEILRGTKFLMTYKGITDEVMPKAIKVMADFAALTGGDVASAANILGKASMGMTGEMARYGITLSETAKKSKDFGLILKEIDEQVGGQNKALAETSSGALKQFANAWGDLKEIGGNIIKIFLVPLVRLLSPIVSFLTQIDSQTQLFIGTLGIAAASILVLAKSFKVLGISARTAIGPIGWIIAAIEIIATALITNMFGIRDRLVAFGSFLKNAWKGILGWFKGEREGESLGDVIAKSWNDAFANIKEITKSKLPEIKAAGVAVGEAFNEGVNSVRKVSRSLAGGMSRDRGDSLSDKITKLFADNANLNEATLSTEPVKVISEKFAEYFDEIKLTSKDTFSVIQNGMSMLSNNITSILWGGRNKIKDVWKAIAKDFTNLFISEIIRQVEKVLVVKLLELLALFDKKDNDMMAVRIGRDYANFFTKGVLSAIQPGMLAGAMAGGFSDRNIVNGLNVTNSRLAKIESGLGRQAAVNVNISSERIYNAARFERSKEKIRQGSDINQPLFR